MVTKKEKKKKKETYAVSHIVVRVLLGLYCNTTANSKIK